MVEQKKLVKPIELTLVTPAGDTHRVLMKQSPFTIGRHESCDLVLNSQSVSRVHCQLKLKSFGLTVKDLQSRNGTYLDEEQIASKQRIPVNEGSAIKIGKFFLRVEHIHREVEIAEGGALLLSSPRDLTSQSLLANADEPDQLLAQLEQFIVHTNKKRRPNDKALSINANGLADGTGITGDSRDVGQPLSTRVPSQEDTVHSLPQETKLSGPSSGGHTSFESEDTEQDQAELQRLKLREQLDANKPRDSKEAAIQALRNLFGHR